MNDLPAHVEETVQALADLHFQHHAETRPIEKGVARVARLIAAPYFIACISLVFTFWIIYNIVMQIWWQAAVDPPPFFWLAEAATLLSVYMTLLILVTQRRENDLTQHRDNLTLQLALLSERKNAKIIELIEELRRDSPHLRDRYDHEAASMARPADTFTVAEAIKASNIEQSTDRPNSIENDDADMPRNR